VKPRGRLLRKYVVFFAAVVCLASIPSGAVDIWFYYREYKALLVEIQRAQATTSAARISQFFKEIEGQVGWTTHIPWSASTADEWRLDVVRLLRQVPAITEVAKLDASGREQLRISRLVPDVIGSQADLSGKPEFVEAIANKAYYGPVYFRGESEPYMTLALAGARRNAGVTVAEVNLKFIWDVISQIKFGDVGYAFVVDARGRLVAHPDLSLVLRNLDLSHLAQVKAARDREPGRVGPAQEQGAFVNFQGESVLSANAPVVPLGWNLFIELPVEAAFAPFYESLYRSLALLIAALLLAALAAFLLARRMIQPIQTLGVGAARIGKGELHERISIKTGDELEALGEQFNSMAGQLQESYANLERKVEERTHELEVANLAKSRFIAAASHDLRQPLHALGLFIAQLRPRIEGKEAVRLVDRIDQSIAAMNELFNALLDVSKLDAGVLTPNLTEFPIDLVLKRAEATFAGAAREKGLALRISHSSAWIRSDLILLERILLNLISNAIRYTARGEVVVTCRRRGSALRIEVVDTGAGIAEDQQAKVFGEFYRVAGHDRNAHAGLGLGLAIVDRLCRLLDHKVELTSTVGAGSCFAVVVPVVTTQSKSIVPAATQEARPDALQDKIIVVLDDDPLVLEGSGGLLRSWGCHVVTADSASEAAEQLDGQRPDLIMSDYHLANGRKGTDEIEELRAVFEVTIPAFLISGDTAPDQLRAARASGYHLLHKPLRPMALRSIVTQLLKGGQGSPVDAAGELTSG
jgi:signal transduction histidine kinase/CheY-like chemotaxis protein